ncbi:hypothetical protein [Roseibium sp. Sym1]|uniref:hypothetical protein n=1 Tax=Roseibium sp. Sym1 TaxID=3016006 RepID=UPI0022B2D4CB|nr:hypothetical protein [Roseibium sp. Sym1]
MAYLDQVSRSNDEPIESSPSPQVKKYVDVPRPGMETVMVVGEREIMLVLAGMLKGMADTARVTETQNGLLINLEIDRLYHPVFLPCRTLQTAISVGSLRAAILDALNPSPETSRIPEITRLDDRPQSKNFWALFRERIGL